MMDDIYTTLEDKRNRVAILKLSYDALHVTPIVKDISKVQIIDWVLELKASLRENQKLIVTDSQKEIERLRGWCQAYPQKLILIKNADYMLTKLSRSDRLEFWRRVFQGLPYLESVVAYMVIDSAEILPPNLLDWIGEGRVFSLCHTGEVVQNDQD